MNIGDKVKINGTDKIGFIYSHCGGIITMNGIEDWFEVIVEDRLELHNSFKLTIYKEPKHIVSHMPLWF